MVCSCKDYGFVRVEQIIDTRNEANILNVIATCRGIATALTCLDRVHEPVMKACMEYAVKNKEHIVEANSWLGVQKISYDTVIRKYTVHLICGWYKSTKEIK